MFDHANDLCMGFFRQAYDAGAMAFPQQARVLELGCAEADWQHAMKTARPDLHLTGIDQRGAVRPDCDRLLHEDILTTQAFQPHEFDAIVAVSMIEWAGIGHYGDPRQADGDSVVMQRAHGWLKPDGFLYFDVPYNRDGHIHRGPLRAYSDASLQARLFQGLWVETWRQYFTGDGHPDGPYVALVVKPV